MPELEERYEQARPIEPLPQKKRMPVILEDGTVVYPEEEKESIPVKDFKLDVTEKAETEVDLTNRLAVRQKLATYCNALMANPSDQGSIGALFKLVQRFDESRVKTKEIQNDIDMSLEILLKNTREEGPMSQLRGLYNARLDRKFQELIKNCFQGHQAAYAQLQTYLKTDIQFQNHVKIVTLAMEVLRRQRFQADSCIFFQLFGDVKVTKVSNLVPKERQKKDLTKKTQKKKGEKEGEISLSGMSSKEAEEELRENQTAFISNLILISTTIIRERQKCGLLPQAFEMIIRFGGFLNAAVYADILAVIKLYFYNWFKQQKSMAALMTLLGEQEETLFNLRVAQQFRIQNAVNTVQIYIKNHADLLELYDPSFLQDFDLALRVAQLLSNPIADEEDISKDSSVVLVFLLAHCYKINSPRRAAAAVSCFKNLLLGVAGVQQANLLKKLSRYVHQPQFVTYAKAVCAKFNVTWGAGPGAAEESQDE